MDSVVKSAIRIAYFAIGIDNYITQWIKSTYIKSVLAKTTVVVLQEHWLYSQAFLVLTIQKCWAEDHMAAAQFCGALISSDIRIIKTNSRRMCAIYSNR